MFSEKVLFFCESRTTSSESGEGRKINLDNDNLKMGQNDVENNQCEAYGVGHATLTTRSRMDYEEVF